MWLISFQGVPKIGEMQAAPSPDASWAGALRVTSPLCSPPALGPAGVGPALGEHPAPCWGLRTPDPPSASGSPAIPWFCLRREAALTSPPRNVALRKVEGARKVPLTRPESPFPLLQGQGSGPAAFRCYPTATRGLPVPLSPAYGVTWSRVTGGARRCEISPAWWHHPTGPTPTPSSRHHLTGVPCPKVWLPEVTSVATERSRKGRHTAPAGQATA